MIGLAFSLGFCTGAGLGSFVVLVVCLLAMRDRRVRREPARIDQSLYSVLKQRNL